MNRKARRIAAKQLRTSDIKGTDEVTTQVLIDQAVASAQAGNWVESEKMMRHVLAAQPDNAEALHILGMTLGSTGRATEGIELLKRATELKPGEGLYWNNLSTCYMAGNRYVEAVEAARKAVIAEPGYVAGWSRLGDVYCELKDFSKAFEAYERVVVLGGADLNVKKRMGVCLMNLDRLAEAEEMLSAAREAAPDDLDVLSNLGSTLVERGKFAAAVPCLAAAVEADNYRATVAFNYARALAGVGELPQAIRWARKTTSLDHRLVAGWLLLGELLLQSGDISEASVAIKRASSLAPGSEAVERLLRRMKDATPQPDKAAKSGPVMWDFHLGDDKPMAQPAGGGLDVSFGKGAPSQSSKTNGTHGIEVRPAQKESKPGIVDLTVLKIG